MIRSMTGFARREIRADWGNLAWELRSVNHRYLEVSIRMPEEFRVLETSLRQTVAERLRRGKVDCNLRFKAGENDLTSLNINDRLLAELLNQARGLARELLTSAPLDPIAILRWPGVVSEPERDPGPMHQAALDLLGETLEMLDETRRREGERMQEAILERLAGMEQQVAAVRARLPEVRQHLRDRVIKRIEQLELEPDQERLEQELALLGQKMDVDEELDRLDGHVEETRHVLKRREPVGRRLDFLMQEFNREANTLSSKSQDVETTRAAVEMKVLIEQMREQVQNVE